MTSVFSPQQKTKMEAVAVPTAPTAERRIPAGPKSAWRLNPGGLLAGPGRAGPGLQRWALLPRLLSSSGRRVSSREEVLNLLCSFRADVTEPQPDVTIPHLCVSYARCSRSPCVFCCVVIVALCNVPTMRPLCWSRRVSVGTRG